MTDKGLKKAIAFVLNNRRIIGALLDRFHANDIEKGMLNIHQDIINKDIKMLIMDNYSEYLNDYQVIFNNNAIFLDLDLNAKQLGRIKAKFMLKIVDFQFNQNLHRIKFSYQEDVKSEGNFMQNMAIKAAGLKGSYLQTAVEMSKITYIVADKDSFTIDIDMLDTNKKIPPSLELNYISSENEILKLHFHL